MMPRHMIHEKNGEKKGRITWRQRLQVEMKIPLLPFRLIYKTITIIMMQREKHERWKEERERGVKEKWRK